MDLLPRPLLSGVPRSGVRMAATPPRPRALVAKYGLPRYTQGTCGTIAGGDRHWAWSFQGGWLVRTPRHFPPRIRPPSPTVNRFTPPRGRTGRPGIPLRAKDYGAEAKAPRPRGAAPSGSHPCTPAGLVGAQSRPGPHAAPRGRLATRPRPQNTLPPPGPGGTPVKRHQGGESRHGVSRPLSQTRKWRRPGRPRES